MSCSRTQRIQRKTRAAVFYLSIAVVLGGFACKQRSEEKARNEFLESANKARLGESEFALLNLACAVGLAMEPSEPVNVYEERLTGWADRVRKETARHLYRFGQNPAEFDDSESFFRMVMLAVVLSEDFGVRYDPRRQSGPDQANANDAFFADSRFVFIHGLLGPARLGTCSSMPVLYAAIGRRLGYPLKLVTTKGHLFLRWEGNGERFNIECTGKGVNKFDDDYYRTWPFQITPEEETAEGYLKSLTPQEEHAVFLSIRGSCLRDNGRFAEAAEAFSQAAQLAPGVRSYKLMAETLAKPPITTRNFTRIQTL